MNEDARQVADELHQALSQQSTLYLKQQPPLFALGGGGGGGDLPGVAGKLGGESSRTSAGVLVGPQPSKKASPLNSRQRRSKRRLEEFLSRKGTKLRRELLDNLDSLSARTP